MKDIKALLLAGGYSIVFSNLHPANSTNILIFIIFALFLHNNSLGRPVFDTLKKIGNFVWVDDAIGHEISEFFVSVFVLAEEGMVGGDSEDFSQNVDSMSAVEIFDVAGAFKIISDGNFELGSIHIFQNEAGSAGDSNQVKFLHPRKQLLYS